MKYSGADIKELRVKLGTKSLLVTFEKFGVTGIKGYPTQKGKKFMVKVSHNEVSIIDADGLVSYIKDLCNHYENSLMIGNIFKDSHLELNRTKIVKHDDFYIVEDKDENYCYYIVYAISEQSKLNHKELRDSQEQEVKNDEVKRAEYKKQKELDEHNQYYSHAIWNTKQILGLTPMQRGRLRKSLDTLFRWDGVILSLKDKLEKENPLDKEMSNNMHRWNRKKYNAMDGDEQRDYDKKLLSGRTHYAGNYEVAKIIFDVLEIEDITDIEKLDVA